MHFKLLLLLIQPFASIFARFRDICNFQKCIFTSTRNFPLRERESIYSFSRLSCFISFRVCSSANGTSPLVIFSQSLPEQLFHGHTAISASISHHASCLFLIIAIAPQIPYFATQHRWRACLQHRMSSSSCLGKRTKRKQWHKNSLFPSRQECDSKTFPSQITTNFQPRLLRSSLVFRPIEFS